MELSRDALLHDIGQSSVAILEADEDGHASADHRALRGVCQKLADSRLELRECGRLVVTEDDAGVGPDDLTERPVRAVRAIWKTAAAQHTQRRLSRAPKGFLDEARLAHACLPKHGHQLWPRPRGDCANRVKEYAKLLLATDELSMQRREASMLDRNFRARTDCWMGEDRLGLPLGDYAPGGPVLDRAAAERTGALADEDLARLGALLETRPDVDRVAGDKELRRVSGARHGLPRVHA